MKCTLVFFLGAAAVFADDFTTGQAARLVIGQETFTSQDASSSDTVLGGVSGIAYAADTLFVADSNRVSSSPNNHRILLFKNLSSQLPPPAAHLDYTRKCPVCLGQASVVLGQPDFTTTTESIPATQNDLRLPTSVASDGVHVVVADTNHNRVLIWNSIPSSNDQPANVVVGQPDFQSSSIPGNTPTAKSMRGPQGVWIQNGKLYVADTQNNRVLIYNRIPTSNGAAADVVLGQPNLTTFVQPDLTQQQTGAQANLLLNPVSVTSDGLRLFVTDLGYNRVLIWNGIPNTNQQGADVVVGQPDMASSFANNAFSTDANDTTVPKVEHPVLCTTSTGTDTNGNPTYPTVCNATLNFPRYALSDGKRLFIADGGNDRVLVFQQIPSQNGQSADVIIGQLGGTINQASDAADSLRTPLGLAWDGTNLYVSDAYNRRITVYSVGANTVPYSGVRNAASLEIFAVGGVTIGGSITAGDSVRITIGNSATNASTCTASTATDTGTTSTNCGNAYIYKVQSSDTLTTIVDALVSQINSGSGDANVLAYPDTVVNAVLMTAKTEGSNGNNVTYTPTVSTNATVTATAAGANLTGGGDASQLGPGTTVSIMGSGLSSGTASADLSQKQLPTSLGGTEVYVNGIRAPLYYVSPTQVNAQIPWEVNDTTSVSVYVRSAMSDGSVTVTTPIAASIVTQNPGIYTQAGYTQDPKPGVIMHAFSQASGVILVDGTVNANDVAKVTIENRTYSYTVQSSDTLDSIRDALVAQINQDPKVSATAGITFARNVLLKARIPGPDANGLPFSATTTNASGSPQLILTATNSTLCCANVANSPVTQDNPAVPGETIIVYATGLGLPVITADIQPLITTGLQYPAGSPVTVPVNFVSSLAGGKTANVLSASLQPGSVGTFQVLLQLNSSMATDPFTNLYIAQDIYISNIVTFAVVAPTTP
jgi:hypothetical protein